MKCMEDTVILQKTKELCQAIVEQPDFQTLRRQIDTFLGDETAKTQYQTVIEKGEVLQQKQQSGQPLSHAEIQDFEKHREALVNNPVAKGFLEAQHHMHKVQESVGRYLTKTFELGRMPTAEELAES